jgi:hypothetical protein
MHNDPELSGRYLGTISEDFVKVSDNLKEASYQIRKRGFSEHPIFPVSRNEQPVGQLLVDTVAFGTQWNYFASYLDEFRWRRPRRNRSVHDAIAHLSRTLPDRRSA